MIRSLEVRNWRERRVDRCLRSGNIEFELLSVASLLLGRHRDSQAVLESVFYERVAPALRGEVGSISELQSHVAGLYATRKIISHLLLERQRARSGCVVYVSPSTDLSGWKDGLYPAKSIDYLRFDNTNQH